MADADDDAGIVQVIRIHGLLPEVPSRLPDPASFTFQNIQRLDYFRCVMIADIGKIMTWKDPVTFRIEKEGADIYILSLLSMSAH